MSLDAETRLGSCARIISWYCHFICSHTLIYHPLVGAIICTRTPNSGTHESSLPALAAHPARPDVGHAHHTKLVIGRLTYIISPRMITISCRLATTYPAIWRIGTGRVCPAPRCPQPCDRSMLPFLLTVFGLHNRSLPTVLLACNIPPYAKSKF